MIFLIFCLIYIFSAIIIWITIYIDEKDKIYTFGDILDETEGFYYIPIFNTIIAIIYLFILVLEIIVVLLKLDVFWNKIKNIKIK